MENEIPEIVFWFSRLSSAVFFAGALASILLTKHVKIMWLALQVQLGYRTPEEAKKQVHEIKDPVVWFGTFLLRNSFVYTILGVLTSFSIDIISWLILLANKMPFRESIIWIFAESIPFILLIWFARFMSREEKRKLAERRRWEDNSGQNEE